MIKRYCIISYQTDLVMYQIFSSAGPLSAENQSEASCSITTSQSKEKPQKRKRTDEEPEPQPQACAKRERRETEQSCVKRKKRHVKRDVKRINPYRLGLSKVTPFIYYKNSGLIIIAVACESITEKVWLMLYNKSNPHIHLFV